MSKKYDKPVNDLDDIVEGNKQPNVEEAANLGVEPGSAEETPTIAISGDSNESSPFTPFIGVGGSIFVSDTHEEKSDVVEDAKVAEVTHDLITGMVMKSQELEEAAASNKSEEVKEETKTEIKKEKTMSNNFYVPKNIKAEKPLTKEAMKKVDSLNLDEVLKKELTGTGKSEITGLIDVHVSAETMKAAIIRVITAVKEKVSIDDKSIFDTFIKGIVGISAQLSYDLSQAPLTVANFHKEATNKILAESPNTNQATAAADAEALVTGYIGKSVAELKGAAASLPVKLLTLVVKKSAIPTANGKDDKVAIDLICNCFTSEQVKSVLADEEYLYIGINLSKMFKFAQGHFDAKALDDTTMVSATIVANAASVSSIVYRVEKK